MLIIVYFLDDRNSSPHAAHCPRPSYLFVPYFPNNTPDITRWPKGMAERQNINRFVHTSPIHENQSYSREYWIPTQPKYHSINIYIQIVMIMHIPSNHMSLIKIS